MIKNQSTSINLFSLVIETMMQNQRKGFPFSTQLPSSHNEYQRTGFPFLNRHNNTPTFSCMHMKSRPAHSDLWLQSGLQ